MRIMLDVHSPAISGEWSEKNEPLKPSEISYGSNRKVWWKGVCGHEWEASVKNRVNGAGCPFCAGRKCLPGFNDFASQRPETAKEWSAQNLPLRPEDFMTNANRKVWWKCRTCDREWQARVSDRAAGSGCPLCSGRKLEPGINDLETLYPDLMEDWSDRNFEQDPMMTSPLSRENVWWQCHECGYEWQAVIATRVRGQKCPLCTNKILVSGYNDLLTNEPELCVEWHPYKNCDCSPETVICASDRNVWWKCAACGYSWADRISHRISGAGCPRCADLKVREEPRNDLLDFADRHDIDYCLDDDRQIGLPFDVWFPEYMTAVDFPELHKGTKKEELKTKVKALLCEKAGIDLLLGKEGVEQFCRQYTVLKAESTS